MRATGGLDDTVEAYNPQTSDGTGFKFREYQASALTATLREALAVYRNPEVWRRLQANAMARDFSWRASASRYAALYETARKERIPTASRSS